MTKCQKRSVNDKRIFWILNRDQEMWELKTMH
jgi:hypothetical protein